MRRKERRKRDRKKKCSEMRRVTKMRNENRREQKITVENRQKKEKMKSGISRRVESNMTMNVQG